MHGAGTCNAPGVMTAKESILRGGLNLAVTWLIARQRSDGSWDDFWLPGGPSDEWVTAYAGAALASVPDERAMHGARRAWAFLAAQHPGATGWGYSRSTPPDSDSTAWACILANRIDANATEAAKRGMQFLKSVSSGAAGTYRYSDAIREYVGADSSVSFEGWMQPHMCVTGAVALASDSAGALCDAMLQAQRADGSWQSYWWPENLYATAMCASALSRHDRGRSARDRAAHHTARVAESEGGPFALALAALVVAAAEDEDAAAHFVSRIAELQREDGSWASDAVLRVPAPDVIDPESVPSYYPWLGIPAPGRTVAMCNFSSRDVEGVFTTATAVSALAATIRPHHR